MPEFFCPKFLKRGTRANPAARRRRGVRVWENFERTKGNRLESSNSGWQCDPAGGCNCPETVPCVPRRGNFPDLFINEGSIKDIRPSPTPIKSHDGHRNSASSQDAANQHCSSLLLPDHARLRLVARRWCADLRLPSTESDIPNQTMMEHLRWKLSALDHRRLGKGGDFPGKYGRDQLRSRHLSTHKVHSLSSNFVCNRTVIHEAA